MLLGDVAGLKFLVFRSSPKLSKYKIIIQLNNHSAIALSSC